MASNNNQKIQNENITTIRTSHMRGLTVTNQQTACNNHSAFVFNRAVLPLSPKEASLKGKSIVVNEIECSPGMVDFSIPMNELIVLRKYCESQEQDKKQA